MAFKYPPLPRKYISKYDRLKYDAIIPRGWIAKAPSSFAGRATGEAGG